MSEDSRRLIYDWIPPTVDRPTPVDRKAYGACHNCSQTFKRKPIHCCLCGEMFDDRCVAKYHLPPTFETKAKPGPSPVCFGCRNLCMAWRDEQSGINMTDARKPLFKSDIIDGQLHIYPPTEWSQADKSDSCKTCDRIGCKRHHCRTCGELYCGECSSKMIVSDPFNKKHKPGPQRICNECRFLIIAGAVLSEPSAFDEVRKPFRNMISRKSTMSSGASIPAIRPSEPFVILKVFWYGDNALIADLKCGFNWDLDIIDKVLRRSYAFEAPYVYLYRNKPIAIEHWTAFTVRQLKPFLAIRKASSFRIRWTSGTSIINI